MLIDFRKCLKYFCAKRYVHREWLNPNFPSVRTSVPQKIDFCRKDMKGPHMLRSLDEAQQRFLATPKVNSHLTRLATGKRTFRNPILDPVLVTLLSKVNKNVTDTDQGAHILILSLQDISAAELPELVPTFVYK